MNINDENKDRTITIALAKGRLADQSMQILESCGVDCCEIKQKSRKLIYHDKDGKYRFLLVKPSDVPTYVQHGVADVGIAGKDTLIESNFPLYEMLDLRLGACRMCVCGFALDERRSITVAKKRVATKYTHIAQEYYAQKGEAIELIKLNGSVEIAPLLGLSDVIVDIVESGRTLQENGLAVLETICHSTARLVVNRVSLKLKREQIQELIEKMRNVIRARENEYDGTNY